MQTPRDVLTPDALSMLQAIAKAGSFASAAREMGMVPSALTYRVRQIEDALDVLLYDRSSRQAKMTEAGEVGTAVAGFRRRCPDAWVITSNVEAEGAPKAETDNLPELMASAKGFDVWAFMKKHFTEEEYTALEKMK